VTAGRLTQRDCAGLHHWDQHHYIVIGSDGYITVRSKQLLPPDQLHQCKLLQYDDVRVSTPSYNATTTLVSKLVSKSIYTWRLKSVSHYSLGGAA